MNVLRLAIADLRHDFVHFLCAAILISAIIGPLLVLLGIKVGAVNALFTELRAQPENLAVSIDGAHAFSGADVARVRALPGVAFAEGQNLVTTTGALALRRVPDGDRAFSARYGTTGPGDPLTAAGARLTVDQLILSAALARRLEVETGQSVALDLERGPPEEGWVQPEFSVVAILPEEAVPGNFVLLNAEAVSLIEAYGFGYRIPQWGVSRGEPLAGRNNRFEKIRIYAADLEALPDLARQVEEELGVQTSSREAAVKSILQLERNLNAIFVFISGAGFIGMIVVLSAHFWSAVRRKKQTWSMLSLMGALPNSLAYIPIIQAIAVSVAGFLGGFLMYNAVVQSISAWFADLLGARQSVSDLPVDLALLVCGAVVAASILASVVAARSLLRTDPAEIIRAS